MEAFHRPIPLFPPRLETRTHCSQTHTHTLSQTHMKTPGLVSNGRNKLDMCVWKKRDSFTLMCIPGLTVSCCWAHSSTNKYKVTVSSVFVCVCVFWLCLSLADVLEYLRFDWNCLYLCIPLKISSEVRVFKEIFRHFGKYIYSFSWQAWNESIDVWYLIAVRWKYVTWASSR